jgi:hypothetical protein
MQIPCLPHHPSCGIYKTFIRFLHIHIAICVPSLVEIAPGVPELCPDIHTNIHFYRYRLLTLLFSCVYSDQRPKYSMVSCPCIKYFETFYSTTDTLELIEIIRNNRNIRDFATSDQFHKVPLYLPRHTDS